MNIGSLTILSVMGVLFAGGTAQAAEPEGTDLEASSPAEETTTDAGDASDASSAPGAAAEAAPAKPMVETSAAGADGGRFRFGISGGAGILAVSGYTFPYGGIDLRLGAQVNDLIAVYAQPQLGFYGGDTGFGIATGGLIGASALVDFTLSDRFFVAAGPGFAILNNPSGAELHFRVGGYPLMGRSDESISRKGLMLGADLRLHFVAGYTFVAPTFSIGYEAF